MSIQVQTTHNVVIDYETSTPWRRALAYFVDLIIIWLWYILCAAVFFPSAKLFDGWETLSMMFTLVVMIPVAFYDLIFEYFNNGQSPGKALMKMRVINTDGTVPSFSSYVIRWIFRPIDFSMTIGMLAFIMIGLTKKSQRLGDYVAGTTVIDLQVEKSGQSLTIKDLNFHKEYAVTYPNVLQLLTDRDIQIIISVLRETDDSIARQKLADKIEEVTGYQYDRNTIMGIDNFLTIIVNDYNYLATKTA